jgi:hypothetical protein
MKKSLMMGGVVTALSLTSCGSDSVEKYNKCIDMNNVMVNDIDGFGPNNDVKSLPAAKKALAAAKEAETACDKADQSDTQVKMAQYRINVCLGNTKKAAEIYKNLSAEEKRRISNIHSFTTGMESMIKDGYKDGFTCGVVNEETPFEKYNKCMEKQDAFFNELKLIRSNDRANLPAAKNALAAAKVAQTACDKADQSDAQVKVAQYRMNVCLGNTKKAEDIYDKLSDTEKSSVYAAYLLAEVMNKLLEAGYKDGFTCGVVNGETPIEKQNKCVEAQNAMTDEGNKTRPDELATLPAAKKALAAAKAAQTACDKADQSATQVKLAQYRIHVCLGNTKKAKEIYDKFNDTEKPLVGGAHQRVEVMNMMSEIGYKDGFTCGVVNNKSIFKGE